MHWMEGTRVMHQTQEYRVPMELDVVGKEKDGKNKIFLSGQRRHNDVSRILPNQTAAF